MNPQLFDRSLLRASINRREMLQRLGLAGAGVLLSQFGVQRVLGKDPEPAGDNSEPMPTSPLILSPFQQDLPIPKPLPVSDPGTWRDPNGGLVAPGPAWQQPYQNPFSAVLPAQPVYSPIDTPATGLGNLSLVGNQLTFNMSSRSTWPTVVFRVRQRRPISMASPIRLAAPVWMSAWCHSMVGRLGLPEASRGPSG